MPIQLRNRLVLLGLGPSVDRRCSSSCGGVIGGPLQDQEMSEGMGFLVGLGGRVLELVVPAQAGPGSCRYPLWVGEGAPGLVSKTWGPIFIRLPADVLVNN